MQDDLFAVPPISGEQVTYQDLSPEATPVAPKNNPAANHNQELKPIRSLRLYVILIAVAVSFILISLAFIIMKISNQSPSVIMVTPTPIVTPIPDPKESGIPASLINKPAQIEQDINTVDLQELDISYPQLDWKIRF